jgi:SAM-dependent methyltransferase
MFFGEKYIEYVQKNKLLTDCQKKEFINTKTNIFYVNMMSDKQIITYIDNTIGSEFPKLTRLYVLFHHFLKFDFVDKLINGIKIKRYSDTQIYEYIIKHKEEHQKTKVDAKIYCSPYVYAFELIALQLKDNKNTIKYLDVGCGNGFKAQLFGSKLGLHKQNVYGTDIEQWGPYKENKSKMPINFKLIQNNILDFADDEFDVVTSIFTLHHIEPDSLAKILDECARVLKKTGVLIIIEHHILNDYDHLIVDIEHSLNSHIYDGKADDSYAQYYNWLQMDYILGNHCFKWICGNSLTDTVGFDVRFDNPYYAIYKINK